MIHIPILYFIVLFIIAILIGIGIGNKLFSEVVYHKIEFPEGKEREELIKSIMKQLEDIFDEESED